MRPKMFGTYFEWCDIQSDNKVEKIWWHQAKVSHGQQHEHGQVDCAKEFWHFFSQPLLQQVTFFPWLHNINEVEDVNGLYLMLGCGSNDPFPAIWLITISYQLMSFTTHEEKYNFLAGQRCLDGFIRIIVRKIALQGTYGWKYSCVGICLCFRTHTEYNFLPGIPCGSWYRRFSLLVDYILKRVFWLCWLSASMTLECVMMRNVFFPYESSIWQMYSILADK